MKRIIPDTDSQKIRLIPEIMAEVAGSNRLLFGNAETGEPGLLEIVRNISKNTDTLMAKQASIEELERRVRDIEDRHKRIDALSSKRDRYALAMFSIALSNVAMIILWILGFGR